MSGMDFVKSCSTNVRMIENVLQMQYVLYRSEGGGTKHNRLHGLITSLRENGVLCTLVKHDIWIFKSPGADLTQLIESQTSDWKKHEEASIQTGAQTNSVAGRTAIDALLDAVEGSIAFSLAKQQEFSRIGPWRWLFTATAQEASDGNALLLELYADLNDAGTLVLCTKTSRCWLRRLLPFENARAVILAPCGQVATLSTEHAEDAGVRSDRPKLAAPQLEWKRVVGAHLATEGINIGEDEQWVKVGFPLDQALGSEFWPLRLCLCDSRDSELGVMSTTKADWRVWFHGTEEAPSSFRDPLAVAEEWFLRSSQTLDMSSDEDNAPSVPVEDVTVTADSVAMTPLVTSSPFNQRTAELQAAMSGIYPTPPDGLMTAPMPSQTIAASDGLAELLQRNDITQISESVDGQRTQVENLTSSGAVASYQADHEDLFGDIEEMDFGANEVGDADFDYFDEPDEVANMLVGQEEDVGMALDSALVEADDTAREDASAAASPIEETSRPLSSSPEAQAVQHMPDVVTDTVTNDTSAQPDPPISAGKDHPIPLSPFNIRERLLPPPIPASVSQHDARPLKRSRSFAPMEFNDNLDLSRKSFSYAQYSHTSRDDRPKSGAALPQRRQKSQRATNEPDSRIDSLVESETSEDDSTEDVSDWSETRDERQPPQLPWDTAKRKRETFDSDRDSSWAMQTSGAMEIAEEYQQDDDDSLMERYIRLFRPLDPKARSEPCLLGVAPSTPLRIANSIPTTKSLPSVDQFFKLTKLDVVYIAQVVSEQAFSPTLRSTGSARRCEKKASIYRGFFSPSLQDLTSKSIERLFQNTEECSLEKILLNHESTARTATNLRTTTHPHNPKLPARDSSMQVPPAVFAVPAPYVRVQRGADTWEMLPPAIPFWSALGLGPANTPKDIDVVCIMPENKDLVYLVEDFLEDLRFAYEGLKMGAFSRAHLEDFARGIVPVDHQEDTGLDNVLRAYATKAMQIGKLLACIEGARSDRATVVCLIDPFEQDPFARQYLCACFWLLYKAYRDHVKDGGDSMGGDLVLQILPVSLIASPNEMVVPDAQRMAALAMEIYDRCPPSTKMMATVDSSALPILAAPAIELASLPPRRIGFQLSNDPPSDLLHEGSILHVSYALSSDRQWMTACWIDSTGHYQNTAALSLRGKSLSDVAGDIWEQTMEILAAREVMWRVFIVTTDSPDGNVIECWKKAATGRPRKQMLHVTLLSIEMDPAVQLAAPKSAEAARHAANATTPGGGFLTPASTPQALTFTVSPDASGQTSSPLTPVPTETSTAAPENDPDAFLIDATDESWGMILSPSIASGGLGGPTRAPANGLLVRRGNVNAEGLETLGVHLHWDIRLRPNGLVDDGQSRQTESSLREVLKMYRNLCLLTKMKYLSGYQGGNTVASDGPGLIPLHALCVVEGAQALDEYMR